MLSSVKRIQHLAIRWLILFQVFMYVTILKGTYSLFTCTYPYILCDMPASALEADSDSTAIEAGVGQADGEAVSRPPWQQE